ncbi:MAG TPA: hypothetical protein VHY91_13875 [Pirellulales bacterium]|jgi:hypothetical protein|nr:hypothetical protein [Pirellulales bacterium]
MRKILLALLLVSGLAAAAQAADWSTDGPPMPRLARLQNVLAPPADSMYSLGGYAPADPNMNANPNMSGNPGLIDKTELDSPAGCCGGLWDGYQARPCHHRHHFGMGGGCGHGRASGSNWGGFGGGCGGPCGCAGGYGMGGYGAGFMGNGGGCGCAPACCAPPCRPRHHCPLFGCLKRSCCGDVAACDSCGCGATDSMQSMPTNDNAPRPEAVEPQSIPTPAPAPAPAPSSAQRQPRLLKSMAAMSGRFGN